MFEKIEAATKMQASPQGYGHPAYNAGVQEYANVMVKLMFEETNFTGGHMTCSLDSCCFDIIYMCIATLALDFTGQL